MNTDDRSTTDHNSKNEICSQTSNDRYISPNSHLFSNPSVIDIGLDLTIIVRKTNKMLQGMIFNTYLTCLLLLPAQLYLALYFLCSATSETDALKKFPGYIAAWTFTILSLLSAYRMYTITLEGQNLSNRMQKSRWKLDKFKSENIWYRHDKLEFLMKELLLLSPSPITPYSSFSLSYGTFIKCCGTIVGYLVILIKMKNVNEISVETEPCKNVTE